MISSRYATAFIIIAGIALIPTLIHSYIGMTSDDGRRVQAMSRSLAGYQSEATDRKADWVKETFQSNDWVERKYSNLKGETLILFAARSYDLKRLYHHPELALVRGRDLETLGTVRMSKRFEMPIHLLRGTDTGQKDLIAYTLLHESEFVNDPFLHQLKHAWRSLFHPRKPMTLFFVYDAESLPNIPLEESPALDFLNHIIDDFLSQSPN